jgi:hypothetical protein
MAKKQTRRSISVSRTTYERLKAFCEANNVSMSQLVETRVNDFLGGTPPGPAPSQFPTASRPLAPSAPPARPAPAVPPIAPMKPVESRPMAAPLPAAPMTAVAARYAVEPPPPVIKMNRPQQDETPKPPAKRPDQIFTF